MLIYALAYYKEFGKLPKLLKLQFIGSDFESELVPQTKHLDKITKDTMNTQKGIINNDFKAKPSKFTCGFCAYKTICPNKAKGA